MVLLVTRLFQLECTYWNILALIAFLGCIASYCWYLSAIGHYHWIGRWRKILMKQKNYPILEFDDIVRWGKNKAIHFHSTYKITRKFIAIVVLSWIFVCYSSITKDNFQIECVKLAIVITIGGVLFFIEQFVHFRIGSDLPNLIKKQIEYKSPTIQDSFCHKFCDIIFVIILIVIFLLIDNCCNKDNKIGDLQQIQVKTEMIESNHS